MSSAFCDAEVRQEAVERLALQERLGVQIVAARLLLEDLATELDCARLFLGANEVLDLVPGMRRDHHVQPVAVRLVPGLRDDLDDVAVLEARPERDDLSVDAGADALMSDVGVNRIGKVDRRRAARERFHQALRREGIDLLRIQIDLEVLDEFVRVARLLLVLEQLPHPGEVALVPLIANPPFLVLPVCGDPLLRHPVHLDGADLDLERHAVLADHRGVQRLVAVGPRHGDEILDPARNRRPGLMDDPEHTVTVGRALGHDPQGDEVVDLLELDLLALELLADAVQALDSAVDLDDRNLRLTQLGGNRGLQRFNQPFGGAPLGIHPRPQRFVRLRLQIPERKLLELVLDLAHSEPVGNRRVDVARLLRHLDPALLGQMAEGPHVVQPVGQLHDDDADIVDHGEEHLAEILGLALFARGEGDGTDLGHPLHDVRHLGTEQLANALDGGQRVLDHVVQQTGGNRDRVEPHVGEEVGDRQGVDQVWLPGVAHLPPVLESREDVGTAQQLDVGFRSIRADLFEEILEANHGNWCLTTCRTVTSFMIGTGQSGGQGQVSGRAARLDLPFLGSLYWRGFGHGKFLTRTGRS